jgi:ATP-dependent Clp protease ATP-binding subunit ClpA
MEEIEKELKKLEDDLKAVETACADELLGHPYRKKRYVACEEKIIALKNEKERLEKEEFKKKANELHEEINRLREEHEKKKD